MTRDQMLERIRRHEGICNSVEGAAFRVVEVMELALGVLAVLDTDGERCIFFDKAQCQIQDRKVIDIGSQVRHFNSDDPGLIEDSMSVSWQETLRTAKMGLKKVGSGKMKWNKEPVPVTY